MSDEVSLRDVLAENFDKAESGTLERVEDAPEIQSTEVKADSEIKESSSKPRDEKGRFTSSEKENDPPSDSVSPEIKAQDNVEEDKSGQESVPPLVRPTTWKKEYLPLWEKMANGETLSPQEARKLAEYSNQREHEYSHGVSTYKQMADDAKQLQDAISPFVPYMQAAGVNPAQVMQNLGNAHMILTRGSPEQKLQAFAKLANDYGVPFDAIPQAMQGQYDSNAMQIMQMQQHIQSVQQWQQQQEQAMMQRELSRFNDTKVYPYFNDVRMDMAQLLESGVAKDLDDAYKKAIRLNDNVFEAQQTSYAQNKVTQTREQAIEAAKTAKERAVSTKGNSPIAIKGNVNAADNRKAALEAEWDKRLGNRI